MTNEIKLAFSHPVERSRSNFSATELHSNQSVELLREFVSTLLLR